MAIAIALLGFNDLGCSVTPSFLFGNRFYLQLSPHCPFSFPELRSSWPAPRIESSGRFQSVLATDWSDGNTIKMITGRNRKRMAEGILFSVCRTCNRYIISNNHPLDLFGEKTIREGIVRDWEEFSGLKISVDDGLLPSRICRSCYVTVTTFQEFIKTVVHSKAQHESVIRSKRRKSVQQSPSFTRCGTREKKEQGQLVICYEGFLTKLDRFMCLQCNYCSCV